MYNYQGAPPYGRPPSFGGFPGGNAAPGMGPPPGMAAPGVAPPPGMQSSNQQSGRPGGFPANFQPPPNMPPIDFGASVIRLTTGSSKPSISQGSDSGRREAEPRSARPGLGANQGMDAQRQAVRESMMQLVPPTKEEIVRTIYGGGITEGSGGDEGIERILGSAGNLRRWVRAMDAENKACRFGFADTRQATSCQRHEEGRGRRRCQSGEEQTIRYDR
ncbi:hypothetical protein ABVK25_000828 [Lepraria finkii]|uniref:Uncharacterized protein n=1 Tax=Lepraria finkii TaxID=1340010 RepID=A0ABR4BP90_9LECA